ncbi:MAG: YitT family protein [Deltaproteobacteria bacterium]|nr:YitT family protein [Deltaproteobacteria bacterium]
MPSQRLHAITNTIPWNLFLISMGGLLFSLGVKCFAQQHGFIAGGLFGTGMVIYYVTGLGSASIWYFLLNIPMFILGWFFLSRRFIWYSLYGIISTTIISELVTYNFNVPDPLLASIAAGVLCGAGFGLILRSSGSDGGTTIVAIILYQKFNLRVGQTTFLYNLLLFLLGGFLVMSFEQIMYSLILVFLNSTIADSFSSLFNQRKMALIISSCYKEIAADIFTKLHRGATFLRGQGAFTDQ